MLFAIRIKQLRKYAMTYAVNIRNMFKSSASHILVANHKPATPSLFQ